MGRRTRIALTTVAGVALGGAGAFAVGLSTAPSPTAQAAVQPTGPSADEVGTEVRALTADPAALEASVAGLPDVAAGAGAGPSATAAATPGDDGDSDDDGGYSDDDDSDSDGDGGYSDDDGQDDEHADEAPESEDAPGAENSGSEGFDD
jgi:hypothetical protein